MNSYDKFFIGFVATTIVSFILSHLERIRIEGTLMTTSIIPTTIPYLIFLIWCIVPNSYFYIESKRFREERRDIEDGN